MVRILSFLTILIWQGLHLDVVPFDSYLLFRSYHQVKNCWIDTTPRQLSQPSDHAPVIVEI